MAKKKDTDLVSVQPEMLALVDKANLEESDYETLVEMGQGISEVSGYSKWLLGKLSNAVDTKYGSGSLEKYAKDVNVPYSSLLLYRGAYRKYTTDDPTFTPERYHGQIPWGVMMLVAGRNLENPVQVLDELADKGVHTIEHAYREIKTKETGQEVPKKPVLKLKWNFENNKWKLQINPNELVLIDWTDIKEQLMTYLASLS